MRLLIILLSLTASCFALDNGLALTPPMGWLSWERYRCVVDCDKRPDECISESLIMKTADLMVSEGYLDAGYNYIGIDDCWAEFQRDEDGRLVANKRRFPNGMKYVADYVHSKGLKFGIYGDFGNLTCGGYPGTLQYMEIDAQTWGEWGVDYVKLDGCYVDVALMDEGYPKFGDLLNKTGRPMLYSCSWPVYQEESGIMPDFDSIAKHCNMWRNYDDIEDSWGSIVDIMGYFGNHSRRLATYAGPGHWNDPDMLIIGNFGLSHDQSRVQMAVWALLAAPLLMSNDLARIDDKSKALLLNKKLIEIDQDSLGEQGIRVLQRNQYEVWKRNVVPVVDDVKSIALAFVNYNVNGIPRLANFTFTELEIDVNQQFDAEDVIPSPTQWIKLHQIPEQNINVIEIMVNPTGVVVVKLTPKDSNEIRR